MLDEISGLISDQGEIVKRQAAIIDRLFLLLLQYVQIEELENELLEMRAVAQIQSGWEP